jgi:hypothetical protein
VLKHETITACLLNWKRRDNIRRIVSSLLENELISEIIVWNNGDPITLASCRVIDSLHNIVCYGRYEAARRSSSDVIFVQDDDCIVHNIGFLYERYLEDSNAIHSNQSEQSAEKRKLNNVGHGAIFHRKLLNCFSSYSAIFPMDFLFMRECDMVFSSLNIKRNYLALDLEQLPKLDVALCQEKNHYRIRQRMQRRVDQLKC